MCNNPTTDGNLEWAGHDIVGYVDVTDPVKTQAEHMKRLNDNKAKIEAELESLKTYVPADEEDAEDMEEYVSGRRGDLEMISELLSIPLAVEDLAKIYYKGIGTVPKELKVDVVLAAGCPISPRDPADFRKGSVHDDLRTAVANHLRPGGQLYIVGGRWNDVFHKSIRDGFASLVDYVGEEEVAISSAYMEARGGIPEEPYSVLVRKATGGRRRPKTMKRRKPKKKTRRA